MTYIDKRTRNSAGANFTGTVLLFAGMWATAAVKGSYLPLPLPGFGVGLVMLVLGVLVLMRKPVAALASMILFLVVTASIIPVVVLIGAPATAVIVPTIIFAALSYLHYAAWQGMIRPPSLADRTAAARPIERITKKLVLTPGEPQRLEVSWEPGWTNVRVCLDGNEIGYVAEKKELKQGALIPLGDGSNLELRLEKKFLNPRQLRFLRHGQPLPGSEPDTIEKIHTAAGAIAALLLLDLFVCVVMAFGETELPGAVYGFKLALGASFVALGLVVWKLPSYTILIAALALLCFDVLNSIVSISLADVNNSKGLLPLAMYLPIAGAILRGFTGVATTRRPSRLVREAVGAVVLLIGIGLLGQNVVTSYNNAFGDEQADEHSEPLYQYHSRAISFDRARSTPASTLQPISWH